MAQLRRGQIIAAALDLLDRVGLDGLSTRRLAQELGVQSPALYWHFASMRDLLDAMNDAILAEAAVEMTTVAAEDWPRWLALRAHAFRAAFLAHRDGGRLHAGTRPSDAQLPALEAQVRALTNAGLTAEDALRAMLAVNRYTIGWILEEQAHAARVDQVPTVEPDLSAFPTLQQGSVVLAQHDPDTDFDFGLQALLAGLEERIKPSSSGRSRTSAGGGARRRAHSRKPGRPRQNSANH